MDGILVTMPVDTLSDLPGDPGDNCQSDLKVLFSHFSIDLRPCIVSIILFIEEYNLMEG